MKHLALPGGLLALAGAASIVLYFFGLDLSVLSWMHGLAKGAQWGIRVGLLAVGLVLLILGVHAGRRDGES